MAGCSPANSAATFSTARARPSACASITTWPGSNVSRTGPARSATSAARLTASMTDAAGITAWQPYSSGNLARYLMKSPAMSLAVSLRSPVSKLISPSAGPGCVLAARAPAPADLGPALTVPGLAPASSGSAPVVPASPAGPGAAPDVPAPAPCDPDSAPVAPAPAAAPVAPAFAGPALAGARAPPAGVGPPPHGDTPPGPVRCRAGSPPNAIATGWPATIVLAASVMILAGTSANARVS